MKMFSSLSGARLVLFESGILNVTIFKYSLHKFIETILHRKYHLIYAWRSTIVLDMAMFKIPVFLLIKSWTFWIHWTPSYIHTIPFKKGLVICSPCIIISSKGQETSIIWGGFYYTTFTVQQKWIHNKWNDKPVAMVLFKCKNLCKVCDIQNTSLTPDKEMNILIPFM